MSRKKIQMTVGMDAELISRVKLEAEKMERSRSFIVERILREHFSLTREGELEIEHANHA